ncbi:MAG TPA: 30S ribosomal protein S1 [Armatimonadota bacterium]|jgi:4-hydroxy-3-methylbut-2-enyl diphosphate reductase
MSEDTNELLEGAAPSAQDADDAGTSPSPAESASTLASPTASEDLPSSTSAENISSSSVGERDVEREGVDYSRTFRSLNEGDVVVGTVVHIDREGVLVDVGTKSEGLVPPQELSRNAPGVEAEPVTVGDRIDVYVLEAENQDGNLILSKKRADFERAWEKVMEAKENDQIIHAMVTDRVKGGLVVDLGIRGFIPASHVGSGRVRNLEKYIGQSLPLKLIEVDKERRKVVLSHRLATEEERERQRKETATTLAEGQVRPGIVRRITDYGVFVDLGGIDGLLHISEMSWTRIKHPSEMVKVGDKIQVMVLKVNLDADRVSLGLRQILPDPWGEVAQRYNVGQIVRGHVSRLVPFGAFVALEGGIEGIIPNNELSQKRASKPDGIVKVGDEVEAKVLDIQPEERRMTLSKRQLERQRESEDVKDFSRQQPRSRDRVTIGDVIGAQLAGRGGYDPEAEEAEGAAEETPAPEAEAPVAEAPAAEAPAAEVPAVEAPAAEVPAVEATEGA